MNKNYIMVAVNEIAREAIMSVYEDLKELTTKKGVDNDGDIMYLQMATEIINELPDLVSFVVCVQSPDDTQAETFKEQLRDMLERRVAYFNTPSNTVYVEIVEDYEETVLKG